MTFLEKLEKLHTLNFEMDAANLIFDYLTGRKQWVKINSNFTSYLHLFHSVPQGSILGALLSNLFLCDLILFVEKLILWIRQKHSVWVFRKCWRHSRKTGRCRKKKLFEWFSNNFLKTNAHKCHLILRTDEPFLINADHKVIKNSNDNVRSYFE